MQKSRMVGVLICLGTVLVGVAFILGIAFQSYWAIAIPVVIGFVGVLALAFWIGLTMAVTEIEAPPQATEESASEPKA
jgi:hypothetical protein